MTEKYDFRRELKNSAYKTTLRSHLCGELNKKHIGKNVRISGWVNKRRDHGKLIFIDLRDFSGITQIVFDPKHNSTTYELAKSIRNEFVISIEGIVSARTAETVNLEIPTGEIEIFADKLDIMSRSATPPFMLEDRIKVDEMTRLKYRYYDLRTEEMQGNMRLRHLVTMHTRNYLNDQGFTEVETPILAKSTPEGARDFLVPSRLNRGSFYALPQSPQLFKQILMFSGFDRIYQIARCFRDEDLRADRQPEFTQIDLEMSFIKVDDVLGLIEGLMAHIFKQSITEKILVPFNRLTWQESMETYGTDKPDTRFDLKLNDITDIFKDSKFNIFINVINNDGCIKCLKISEGETFSRKDLDGFIDLAKQYGADGLIWIKIEEDGEFNSPVAKFISDDERINMTEKLGLEKGNLVLIVADEFKKACEILGDIRIKTGNRLNLIETDRYDFCWIVDFPLFEWDKREKRLSPMHHPFTMPSDDTIDYLDVEPLKVKSYAYDIVLNGNELGGGSIRINDIDMQKKIFKILGFDDNRIEENFGFLLKSLEYGAPPHGGIALGMDRLVMLIGGMESIREVIAFPKTQAAVCMMTDSPSEVTEQQLKEAHIKLTGIKKKNPEIKEENT
jgi:aspartyl-tRNA synthetase